MRYKVYYMKPDFFRDGSMGAEWLVEHNKIPDPKALENTHVFLMEVDANNLEHVYRCMQAEVWSRDGEAMTLIRSKGLRHTSMSMGDIVVEVDKDATYIVDQFGFKLLGYAVGVTVDG